MPPKSTYRKGEGQARIHRRMKDRKMTTLTIMHWFRMCMKTDFSFCFHVYCYCVANDQSFYRFEKWTET